MSIYSEQDAKAILDKVIKLSKADECTATLGGSVDGNIRYALNAVSTSGIVSDAELGVQVAFGKRVGTATINEFDDASLEKVVRRAEELARLAPENPEFVPAIGKQTYAKTKTYFEKTAAITPDFRASVAGFDGRVEARGRRIHRCFRHPTATFPTRPATTSPVRTEMAPSGWVTLPMSSSSTPPMK
jgi:hypothetical protein